MIICVGVEDEVLYGDVEDFKPVHHTEVGAFNEEDLEHISIVSLENLLTNG